MRKPALAATFFAALAVAVYLATHIGPRDVGLEREPTTGSVAPRSPAPVEEGLPETATRRSPAKPAGETEEASPPVETGAGLGSISFSGTVAGPRPWRRRVAGAHVRLGVLGAVEALGATTTDGEGGFSLRIDFPTAKLPVDLVLRAEKEEWVSGEDSEAYPRVDSLPYGIREYRLLLSSPLELFGMVVDSRRGSPVAGARVWQPGRHVRSVFLRARTDAAGTFRARVLEASEGFLLVDAPGFLPTSAHWERKSIESPLRIELSGEDEIPWAEGKVVDERDVPIPDLSVDGALESESTPPAEAVGRVARDCLAYFRSTGLFHERKCDGEGRFRFPLPGFGTWVLWVRRNRQFVVQRTQVSEVRTYPCDFRLVENRWVIAGSVRRRLDGLPIRDAKVRLYGTVSGMGAEMVTDASGRFQSPRLQREEFVCVVVAPPHPHEIRNVSFPPDVEVVEVDLGLAEACRVRGRVVDSEENPLADAEVRVDSENWPFVVKTDVQGRFDAGELHPGVTVRVQASFGQPEVYSKEKTFAFEFEGEWRDVGDLVIPRRR